MDLEEEFKKLMEDTLNVIEQRRNDGAYDDWDAAELSSMVKNLLDHGDTSRYGKCPLGHDDPDCGWSPSMGYHCV